LAIVARPWYQTVLKIIYFAINIPFLFLNLIDLEYFMFRGKRTTAEILGISDDIKDQSFQLLWHFWHLTLIAILICIFLYKFYPKFSLNASGKKSGNFSKFLAGGTLLLSCGIYFVIIRGGMQIKPIRPNQAFIFTPNVLGNLVLNTPFSLLHTVERSEIKQLHYFSTQQEARDLLTVPPASKQRYYKRHTGHPNVVIIILESFSSEYTGFGNSWKGYTPFLDSLSASSLFFSHHLSNGTSSIEGLPAIIASIPSLMPEPFITSMYQTNKISGLGAVLKREGYHTSFFHGGTNGTMGFDVFARNAGFENYFGMYEYPDYENNFDGAWGIFDDKYLQFFCKKLSGFPQPFAGCIFTLSSHQPYAIPPELQGKFTEGHIPILRGIKYADYSLKLFFEAAKKQAWYHNTLFVITADHTQEKLQPRSMFNDFHVPLLFFHPTLTEKKHVTDKITEHVDVMPSVLDFLNVNSENCLPFGHTVFDPSYKGRAVTYDWGTEKTLLFHLDYITSLQPSSGNTEVFPFPGIQEQQSPEKAITPLLKKQYEQEVKAFVQYYTNGLVENNWVKEFKKPEGRP
jgi:phosphoglycerol transferase MdoB-like AlkP superfamily enzyme